MVGQDANRVKPFTLQFEKRPEYLYAFVKGKKDSYEISRQYWSEVANECRRATRQKVLIEEDIDDEMSMTEMYRFTSEIMEIGFSGIRVAFVDRYISQRELNKFGALVATNRGFFGKICGDVKAAEEWLLSIA
jgi:hypothetical protein